MEIFLQIGLVLTMVFLSIELIINPFFEMFKNKIILARMRNLLQNGATIHLGPENHFLNKFGLSTGVRSTDVWLFLLKVLKIFVKMYVLVVIAWWESGLSEGSVTREQTSTMAVDAWNRTDAVVSFASVTPHTPLADEDVFTLPGRGGLDVISNGNYSKSRSTLLELQYFSDCIKDLNGVRNAFFSVLRRDGNDTRAVCLNGEFGRDETKLLSFVPDNSRKLNTSFHEMNLTRYIATDFNTIIFAGYVSTIEPFLGRTKFEGYIALTVSSHFQNFVGWYVYGLVMGPGDEMLRAISVATTTTAFDDEKPCSGNRCLGVWRFTPNGVFLPSGRELGPFDPRDYSNQLESVSLKLEAPFSNDTSKSLALAWMAETPYDTFRSNERFIDDIMDRLNGDIFFFSDLGFSTRTLRAFDTRQVTVVANSRTGPVVSAVVILVLFALAGVIAEFRSRAQFGSDNDLLSREALVALYKRNMMGGRRFGNKMEERTIGIVKDDPHESIEFGDAHRSLSVLNVSLDRWDGLVHSEERSAEPRGDMRLGIF